MAHDQFVQVTSSAVRLIDAHTRELISEWKPPSNRSIIVAAGSSTQVIVATGGKHVVYLEVGDHTLVETAHIELTSEVSCLDISPIGTCLN